MKFVLSLLLALSVALFLFLWASPEPRRETTPRIGGVSGKARDSDSWVAALQYPAACPSLRDSDAPKYVCVFAS